MSQEQSLASRIAELTHQLATYRAYGWKTSRMEKKLEDLKQEHARG